MRQPEEQILGIGAHKVPYDPAIVRAYPNNMEQRNVIMAQTKWSKAR